MKDCFPQQTRSLQTVRTRCLLGSGPEPACPGAEELLSQELTDAQHLMVMDNSPVAGKPLALGKACRESGSLWQRLADYQGKHAWSFIPFLMRMRDDGSPPPWSLPSLPNLPRSLNPPVITARNQVVNWNFSLYFIFTISGTWNSATSTVVTSTISLPSSPLSCCPLQALYIIPGFFTSPLWESDAHKLSPEKYISLVYNTRVFMELLKPVHQPLKRLQFQVKSSWFEG